MTTIIVTHEDNEVDEFEFDADTHVITIGRRSSNDVCIPNLSVSGQHARITIETDGASIEDLSSTNGTYINNRLISSQSIANGAEVIIGKTRVSFVHVAATAEAATSQSIAAALDSVQFDDDSSLSQSLANKLSMSGSFDDSIDFDNDIHRELQASPAAANKAGDLRSDPPSASAPQQRVPVIDDDRLPDGSDDSMDADDEPMTLSEKAKLALGRTPTPRPRLQAINRAAANGAALADIDSDTAVAEAAPPVQRPVEKQAVQPHPLDGLDSRSAQKLTHELDAPNRQTSGAVIEIKNGAKSGQVLPIDKPVTTLGRPGIQIAAIMRKPDGYFLMHIESDDSVDRPTLNQDAIGDEPVLLHSGDELNVAGIDVEFMLS